MNPAQIYTASPVKRHRRSNAEIAVIEAEIFAVLQGDHPQTLRSLFYRLVSRGAVDKTENEYGNVGRYLLKLRRSGAVPYGWVADSTRWMRKPRTYLSLRDALESTARTYRRSLWLDAASYVEVYVEKDTLAGVLYAETEPWDVPLMVCRGFSSETYLYEAAEAIKSAGKPTYLYLLTDYDPSGLAIAHDVERRLQGFLPDTEVHVERVAVTEAQIARYGLLTRPTKATDSRSKGFAGESVELDAIPSAELRALVRGCIARHLDVDLVAGIELTERLERATLESLSILNLAPGETIRLTDADAA